MLLNFQISTFLITPVQTFCFFHRVKSTLFLLYSKYKKKNIRHSFFPRTATLWKDSHVCSHELYNLSLLKSKVNLYLFSMSSQLPTMFSFIHHYYFKSIPWVTLVLGKDFWNYLPNSARSRKNKITQNHVSPEHCVAPIQRIRYVWN